MKKHGPIGGQVYDQATIQNSMADDEAFVAWVDVASGEGTKHTQSGEHWAFVLPKNGSPICIELKGTGR